MAVIDPQVPILKFNMSNHRGRFPGRPLSARRTKIRQRITESEVCKSNGPNAYETAQQIQRGINVFRKTFMSSNPAFSSQHDSMVSFHFCHYFGGSLRHRLEKRLKVCNGIKINKEKLVKSQVQHSQKITKFIVFKR